MKTQDILYHNQQAQIPQTRARKEKKKIIIEKM